MRGVGVVDQRAVRGNVGRVRHAMGRWWECKTKCRLTETRNSAQRRQRDDPVIPSPQYPTPIDKDIVSEKIAEREEYVGSDELRCLVCVPRDAPCGL